MYIRTSSFVSLETPLHFIACILQGFVDPKCNSGHFKWVVIFATDLEYLLLWSPRRNYDAADLRHGESKMEGELGQLVVHDPFPQSVKQGDVCFVVLSVHRGCLCVQWLVSANITKISVKNLPFWYPSARYRGCLPRGVPVCSQRRSTHMQGPATYRDPSQHTRTPVLVLFPLHRDPCP